MDKKFKIEVGKRFKQFRIDRKITQSDMAKELNVYQSVITNIENGRTFPKIRYLKHFYKNYFLNINWMLTGEGEMYMEFYKEGKDEDILKYTHIKANDPKYPQYEELIELMQFPTVEEQLLARLSEVKMFFRDEVQEFLRKKAKKSKRKKSTT